MADEPLKRGKRGHSTTKQDEAELAKGGMRPQASGVNPPQLPKGQSGTAPPATGQGNSGSNQGTSG